MYYYDLYANLFIFLAEMAKMFIKKGLFLGLNTGDL